MTRRRHAKGQAIVEMTASLVLFAVLALAITSVSVYLYVQHTMVTAAREGARIASLEPDMATGGGVSEVQTYVVDLVQQTTGIALNTSDVTVTPPDPGAPVGYRRVTVAVNYEMPNPLPVSGVVASFGGTGGQMQTFPVYAEATMRYEE